MKGWVRQIVMAVGLAAAAHSGGGAAIGEEVPHETSAGGLWIGADPSIVLESVELQISPQSVNVAYGMRNTARIPRSVTMSFPLPDLDMAAIGEQPLSLPVTATENFVNAQITADGAAVSPALERRALAVGLDVSNFLSDASVPLFPLTQGIGQTISKLPPLLISDFQQRGMLRLEGLNPDPNWHYKSLLHWRQTFGPSQSLAVKLAYQPMVFEARFSAERLKALKAAHCIDASVEAEITRKVAATQGRATFRWLTYNLTSGSQYIGEISQFRLMIEKPDIGTVVATCRKGLRPAGPTVLEWSAQDFHPDEDIHVLFFE